MSATGQLSTSTILSTLTTGFAADEAAIITGVSAFSVTELVKLGLEEIQQCWAALKHFINNMKAGMSWGEAMASMLTEVWNDTKSNLAQLATDFVEAVGKVFQNVGLLPQGA